MRLTATKQVILAGVSAFLLAAFLPKEACRGARGADENGPPAAFDAAPFGLAESQAEGKAYGIRWSKARKIRRVVVEFRQDVALPDPGKVRLQYWHHSWDGKPDAILTHAAGRAGWTRIDDWTNGQWKDADATVQIDGQRWTFTFAPTGRKEFQWAQR